MVAKRKNRPTTGAGSRISKNKKTKSDAAQEERELSEEDKALVEARVEECISAFNNSDLPSYDAAISPSSSRNLNVTRAMGMGNNTTSSKSTGGDKKRSGGGGGGGGGGSIRSYESGSGSSRHDEGGGQINNTPYSCNKVLFGEHWRESKLGPKFVAWRNKNKKGDKNYTPNVFVKVKFHSVKLVTNGNSDLDLPDHFVEIDLELFIDWVDESVAELSRNAILNLHEQLKQPSIRRNEEHFSPFVDITNALGVEWSERGKLVPYSCTAKDLVVKEHLEKEGGALDPKRGHMQRKEKYKLRVPAAIDIKHFPFNKMKVDLKFRCHNHHDDRENIDDECMRDAKFSLFGALPEPPTSHRLAAASDSNLVVQSSSSSSSSIISPNSTAAHDFSDLLKRSFAMPGWECLKVEEAREVREFKGDKHKKDDPEKLTVSLIFRRKTADIVNSLVLPRY